MGLAVLRLGHFQTPEGWGKNSDSCVESGWIRGDPVLRKRNEAVRDAVQRTNGAGFNVVHPAVQVQPSLLDSECHRSVGSKVGQAGQ